MKSVRNSNEFHDSTKNMKKFCGLKIKKKISAFLAGLALFFPALSLAANQGLVIANEWGLPSGSIKGIIESFLYWILGIFGALGVIGFIIAGIIYLLSAGEEAAIERAKKAMMWSIVGIIVGLSGFVIMQAVNSLLGGNNAQF